MRVGVYGDVPPVHVIVASEDPWLKFTVDGCKVNVGVDRGETNDNVETLEYSIEQLPLVHVQPELEHASACIVNGPDLGVILNVNRLPVQSNVSPYVKVSVLEPALVPLGV